MNIQIVIYIWIILFSQTTKKSLIDNIDNSINKNSLKFTEEDFNQNSFIPKSFKIKKKLEKLRNNFENEIINNKDEKELLNIKIKIEGGEIKNLISSNKIKKL